METMSKTLSPGSARADGCPRQSDLNMRRAAIRAIMLGLSTMPRS